MYPAPPCSVSQSTGSVTCFQREESGGLGLGVARWHSTCLAWFWLYPQLWEDKGKIRRKLSIAVTQASSQHQGGCAKRMPVQAGAALCRELGVGKEGRKEAKSRQLDFWPSICKGPVNPSTLEMYKQSLVIILLVCLSPKCRVTS